MMTNIDVKIRNPYNNCILRKIIYHQYLPMLTGISDPLGAQTDRLRCAVCQNLILSSMNTGPLRSAVATAPTVYGIETKSRMLRSFSSILGCNSTYRLRYWNWIVSITAFCIAFSNVATAPTVYGIETLELSHMTPRIYHSCNSTYRLRYWNYPSIVASMRMFLHSLQQSLPFTVLKLPNNISNIFIDLSCNSPYRSRYWNHGEYLRCKWLIKLQQSLPFTVLKRSKLQACSMQKFCCNSPYRSRYWNSIILLK